MSVEKPLYGFSLQASVFEHRISRAVKRPADFFAVRIRLLCRSIRQEKIIRTLGKIIRTPILFQGSYNSLVAERRGFEPPIAFTILAFQAGTLDHSDTSP